MLRTQTAILACATAAVTLISTGTALAASSTRAPAQSVRLAQPPAWHVTPSPNASSSKADSLNGISCHTATFCTAVGDYFPRPQSLQTSTLIEAWNGNAWTVVPSPSSGGQNNLAGISCVSAGFCSAVGDHSQSLGAQVKTMVETWDGSTWSIVPSPNHASGSTLTGVSCVSTRFCVAVGYYPPGVSGNHKTLIEAWDGSTWSIVPSPSKGTHRASVLDGVSCVSAGSCTAVGSDSNANGGPASTLIEAWDGSTWSIVPSPNAGSSDSLNGVWCGTASSCTAVGDAFTHSTGVDATLVEAWDGSTWSIVPSPSKGASDTLYGVSCGSPGACTAVGTAGKQTLVEAWNGSTWSIASSPSPSTGSNHFNFLGGVSCVAATCTAAGSYGHTTRRTTRSKTLIESGSLPAAR
jgi:hypothetical protein